MRRLALVVGAAIMLGCAKKEAPPAEPPAPPPPPPAPAPINMADVAGKWTVKVMGESSDSVLLTYTLTATADTTGWNIMFPNRKQPVPLHVTASADSLIIDSGWFESALRKGVQVMTHGSMHLAGGMLTGTTTAHYKTTKPDSVVTLRQSGTKNPM
jgi:hypothetical protein